jgi:hypothetical protein
VKDLGDLLAKKKSEVTGLPGQEWTLEELRQFFTASSQSDPAIVTVEIDNFQDFQDRDFSEGSYVLKEVAETLQDIKGKVDPSTPSSLDELLSGLSQQPAKAGTTNTFLGEIDNTGRFIFVTPSQKVAERLQKLIDQRLTKAAFESHYRLVSDPKDERKSKHEYELGYFEFRGKKVNLLKGSTKIIKASSEISDIGFDEFIKSVF